MSHIGVTGLPRRDESGCPADGRQGVVEAEVSVAPPRLGANDGDGNPFAAAGAATALDVVGFPISGTDPSAAPCPVHGYSRSFDL